MKLQCALLVGIGLLSIGCNGGSSATSSAPVKVAKKPGFLRYFNQTSDAVDVKVDGFKMVDGLGPNEISQGYITALRDHKITGFSGGTEFSGTAKPEAGMFVTVVIKNVGGKISTESVLGESSISPGSGVYLEFINLSDAPVTFKSGGESKDVPANKSAYISANIGPQTVNVKGFGEVNFNTEDKEIWGICVTKKGGKLSASAVKQKGPIKATAGGASASG